MMRDRQQAMQFSVNVKNSKFESKWYSFSITHFMKLIG